jgi:tRNA pseudouridine55 synthase
MKKIGHTGTLDPDVTGVLPLVLGQATKLTEYMQQKDKTYRAEVTLGISTVTEDASGEVTLHREAPKLMRRILIVSCVLSSVSISNKCLNSLQ